MLFNDIDDILISDGYQTLLEPTDAKGYYALQTSTEQNLFLKLSQSTMRNHIMQVKLSRILSYRQKYYMTPELANLNKYFARQELIRDTKLYRKFGGYIVHKVWKDDYVLIQVLNNGETNLFLVNFRSNPSDLSSDYDLVLSYIRTGTPKDFSFELVSRSLNAGEKIDGLHAQYGKDSIFIGNNAEAKSYTIILVVDRRELIQLPIFVLKENGAFKFYHKQAKAFSNQKYKILRPILEVRVTQTFIICMNEGNQIGILRQEGMKYIGYQDFAGQTEGTMKI